MEKIQCKNCGELNYHNDKCTCGQWVIKPFKNTKEVIERLTDYMYMEDHPYNFEVINKVIEFLKESK